MLHGKGNILTVFERQRRYCDECARRTDAFAGGEQPTHQHPGAQACSANSLDNFQHQAAIIDQQLLAGQTGRNDGLMREGDAVALQVRSQRNFLLLGERNALHRQFTDSEFWPLQITHQGDGVLHFFG